MSTARVLSCLRRHFDVQPDCSARRAARSGTTSVALDRLAAMHDLQFDGLLLHGHGHRGERGHDELDHSRHFAADRAGVPVAGEYEVKNALAMKIMDGFGAGGSSPSTTRWTYNDDVVLMGHDGPGHIAIAEGKTKVRPLERVSRQSRPRPLRRDVREARPGHAALGGRDREMVPLCGRRKALVGRSSSRSATRTAAIAFRSARDIYRAWNAHGPAHHCAIGVGSLAGQLGKLASLLGIPMHQVC